VSGLNYTITAKTIRIQKYNSTNIDYYNRQVSTKPDFNQQNIHRFSYRFQTPRYSWNTAKVGVKQQSINQSIHIQHLISTMSSTNYVYCNGHKSHLNLFLICKTKHTYPKVSRRKWENTSNILELPPFLYSSYLPFLYWSYLPFYIRVISLFYIRVISLFI
jgi:hypothetical protein